MPNGGQLLQDPAHTGFGILVGFILLGVCALVYTPGAAPTDDWDKACVETIAGARGKVAETRAFGAEVAFASGQTAYYKFANLTKVSCTHS